MVGNYRGGIRFFFVGAALILAAALVMAGADLPADGAAAMRAGRFAEAEKIYRQLLKEAPGDPRWSANLGLALYSQGRHAEAANLLEQSVKAMPNPGLSAVLGISYLKLDQPCKAIEPLEKSNRSEALADAYVGCKRYADAARLYLKLGFAREAARAYWQARDYDAAKPLFASVAGKHTNDAGFNYEYGDTLLRSEGALAALPYLERAAVLVEARGALGKAYVELERFEEAIPHLEAASSADPDLFLPLSNAYKKTGRAAEAERALKRYRERANQN